MHEKSSWKLIRKEFEAKWGKKIDELSRAGEFPVDSDFITVVRRGGKNLPIRLYNQNDMSCFVESVKPIKNTYSYVVEGILTQRTLARKKFIPNRKLALITRLIPAVVH